jgi:hypothetical protein
MRQLVASLREIIDCHVTCLLCSVAPTAEEGELAGRAAGRQQRYGQWRRQRRSTVERPTQMLYIQMEFCPRTLQHVRRWHGWRG